MAKANSVSQRIDKSLNERMKKLVESSEMSSSNFMDSILKEVMDAIDSKNPPDMLPTVKLFREKLGKKNGASPEAEKQMEQIAMRVLERFSKK